MRDALTIRRAVTAETRLMLAEVRAERDAAGVSAAPVVEVTPDVFLEWARAIPEPKSGTLDFDRFPFQREWYEHGVDERDRVVQKAAQVGVSALAVRESLFWVDRFGWTVLYVFPVAALVTEFSDARVRPLVMGSDYLRSRVPKENVANKSMKQIGRGFLYLRGSNSEAARQSVDADAVVFDEYDYIDQDAIPDFEQRVGGSVHQVFRRIGYPTVPEWGMNAAYNASDRRAWMVRCAACSEWQGLDFWKNVDSGSVLVVCSKCRKPLDVASGEWVAEFPGREVRGYHVSKLMVPAVARNERGTLARLVRASQGTRPKEVEAFVTKDLGLPFDTPEGRLSMEALQAAQSAGEYALTASDVGYGGENVVTMGVDVASVRDLNVRVSEHFPNGTRRALFIGTVATFNELDSLMKRFRVRMAAIDHLPEGRLAMAFAERHAGQVYLVAYTGQVQPTVLRVSEETRLATVRRTEAIDAMMDDIREQTNLLPVNLPPGYVAHMRALVRRKRESETGRTVVEYVSTGPTDYAHAEVYDVVAANLWDYRVGVDAALREEIAPLEDQLEFERSAVSRGDAGYEAFGSGSGYESFDR